MSLCICTSVSEPDPKLLSRCINCGGVIVKVPEPLSERWTNEDVWLDVSVVALKKRIWNEAIEQAANECEQWDKGSSPKFDIAPDIRKLKK